jgi:diacylglycerol kinase family enzyme
VLLVAIANGRQYGNGAIIAPRARLDDGKLDVVIINNRSAWRALLEVPLVFLGLAAHVHGVTMEATESVRITSADPVVYHVDGEPVAGAHDLRALARPRALKIKVLAGT